MNQFLLLLLCCCTINASSRENPVCPPLTIKNSTIGTWKDQPGNSFIKVTCIDDYELGGGDGILECRANGTWGEPVPTCIEMRDCPPLSVGNSTIEESNTSSSEVVVSCNHGYVLRQGFGKLVVTCTHNGTWSEAPVCDPDYNIWRVPIEGTLYPDSKSLQLKLNDLAESTIRTSWKTANGTDIGVIEIVFRDKDSLYLISGCMEQPGEHEELPSGNMTQTELRDSHITIAKGKTVVNVYGGSELLISVDLKEQGCKEQWKESSSLEFESDTATAEFRFPCK
eukprot:sb/3467865/